MRRNVAAGIGSNEQGGYNCRAALQRSDRKEPRYKWPTLLYFTLGYKGFISGVQVLPTAATQKTFKALPVRCSGEAPPGAIATSGGAHARVSVTACPIRLAVDILIFLWLLTTMTLV